MNPRRRARSRRATWLAFAVVAVAAFSASAQIVEEGPLQLEGQETTLATTAVQSLWSPAQTASEQSEQFVIPDYDKIAEATRAYKSALATLSSLTTNPSSYDQPYPLSASSSSTLLNISNNSFLTSILPNLRGQGPLGSAIRIAIKLYRQLSPFHIVLSWGVDVPPTHSYMRGSGSGRMNEEMHAKAIKVIDLLQHSAELGNTDALYKLGEVYLSPPTPHFISSPQLAYDSFHAHASQTGNASSHAMLAFFHATGYRGVVPIDQAKALLHYTFAAHGGHKGAQMALGYRYWSGIGTLEDCGRALDWYARAAEQAMSNYLTGPPLGRTLPQTATRLSDLEGGLYGPGASVASSGFNVIKPAIKAGMAKRAGETWADVLEYYAFNADRGELDFAFKLGKIFYQGSIYHSAGGIASGSEGVGRIEGGQDFERARYYFLSIARQIWPRDPEWLDESGTRQKGRSGTGSHSGGQRSASAGSASGLASGVQSDAGAPPTQHPASGLAAKSAAYLGRMYLRGEGVRPDRARALLWFERGAEYEERECLDALGMMWRDGLIPDGRDGEGQKDPKKAAEYFALTARHELAEGYLNLGKEHFFRGELKHAATYFETAIRHGSPFEAYFYLATIHNQQLIQSSPANPPSMTDVSSGSCATAVSFYKIVAERGVWDDDLLFDAEKAWEHGGEGAVASGGGLGLLWDWLFGTNATRGEIGNADGDGWDAAAGSWGKEVAALKWAIAAEQGFEIAQNNLGWLLDQDKSILRHTRFLPLVPSNDTARITLTQWTRAAAQRNVDALVKVADYYYHGLGLPDGTKDSQSGDTARKEKARFEKAARYYQSAADTQSALAMWNLGWLYENGIGVEQDFHLAKRHYDLALETNSDAYLPVLLSLIKLYARSFWHTLRGGQGGLTLWESEEDSIHTQGEAQGEIEAGAVDESTQNIQNNEETVIDEVEDDGPWYIGKAREEFQRRRQRDGGRLAELDDTDDPVQWARDRRNTENERDNGDFGPEDYFDGALRAGHREEGRQNEFGETMLLVLLCIVLSVLIYVRTRIMEALRRGPQEEGGEGNENENGGGGGGDGAPRAQQDLGMFPPPGDPARAEWNILR